MFAYWSFATTFCLSVSARLTGMADAVFVSNSRRPSNGDTLTATMQSRDCYLCDTLLYGSRRLRKRRDLEWCTWDFRRGRWRVLCWVQRWIRYVWRRHGSLSFRWLVHVCFSIYASFTTVQHCRRGCYRAIDESTLVALVDGDECT